MKPAGLGPAAHERPLFLLLPEDVDGGEAIARALAHPLVACYQLPPPWVFEDAAVYLPGAMPEMRTVTLENLPEVVRTLERLCTREVLDRAARRLWGEVGEDVRAWFLERGTLSILAAALRLAPRTAHLPPPPAFVMDRVHAYAFEAEYRLAPQDEGHPAGTPSQAPGRPPAPEPPFDPKAPPHEGSLVLYPFDPRNAAARVEGGLGPGRGAVVEAFAYAAGRARHLAFLREVAREQGWQVVDPEVEPPR